MRASVSFLAGFAFAAVVAVALDRWLNEDLYRRYPFVEPRPC